MMDKNEFSVLYLTPPTKIRVSFDVCLFLQDQSVGIIEETIRLADLLDYYVPSFEKNGIYDTRDIADKINDLSTTPLTMSFVVNDPAKWGLGSTGQLTSDVDRLDLVPIASDTKSGRTLILDSNHTLVNLIHGLNTNVLEQKTLSVVRIIGADLQYILDDFKIINKIVN